MRDLFASVILKEDAGSIALNGIVVIIDIASYVGLFTLIGAIPGYLASIGSTELMIGLKFLGHHVHYLTEVFGMVMSYVKLAKDLRFEVDAAKQLLKKANINPDSLYDNLVAKGVTDEQFARWAGKIGSQDAADKVIHFLDEGNTIPEIDYVMTKCQKFDDVSFIKSGEHQFYGGPIAYWFEKGDWNFGEIHVDERHVTGTKPGFSVTGFWPMGHKVRINAPTTPNKMDINQLRGMIKDSIDNGVITQEIDHTGRVRFVFEWTLNIEQYGVKKVKTIVEADGKIVTSYPVEGSSVLKYSDKLQKVIFQPVI